MHKLTKVFDKLFDTTGDGDGNYKGFVAFYIDETGTQRMEIRCENIATFLAIKHMIGNTAKRDEISMGMPMEDGEGDED